MTTSRFFILLILSLPLIYGVPARAVNIRHDVKDEKYIQLAGKEELKPGLVVTRPGAEIPGSGIIIHPNFILTAGHVGSYDGEAWMPVRYGTSEYMVDHVYLYPEYSLDNPNPFCDISLLRLTGSGITNVKPAVLWFRGIRIGDRIRGVGFGRSFTGKQNSKMLKTGVFRAYENTIDYICEDDRFNLFIADFDGPGNTGNSLLDTVYCLDNLKMEGSSSGEPLPYEGSVAEGDSGSGVWILRNKTYYLSGIASGRYYNCYYAQSLYVNLSCEKISQWILSVCPDTEVAEER